MCIAKSYACSPVCNQPYYPIHANIQKIGLLPFTPAQLTRLVKVTSGEFCKSVTELSKYFHPFDLVTYKLTPPPSNP
jgi:hypothetical protein